MFYAPISTDRLRDVLDWLRTDADGQEKPDEGLVFSNEVGEPLRLFHRTWQTLVLRAHGHTATWAARLNYQGLSDESQDAFRKINVRGHAFTGTKFQDSFKIAASEAQFDRSPGLRERPAIEANALKELDLQNWLGVRDELRNWLVTAA